MILFLIFLLFLALAFSSFFSGSESGLYFIKRDKLSIQGFQKNPQALRLISDLKEPAEIISVTLIGNTMALQLATYAMASLLEELGCTSSMISNEILVTIILFIPFFIFAEVLPKTTYRLYADKILLPSFQVLHLFRLLFKPITIFVVKLNSLFGKMAPGDKESELVENFDRQYLSLSFGHAYAGGVLSEEQLGHLNKTLHLGDSQVEKLMRPILREVVLDLRTCDKSILKYHKSTGRNTFPVYSGSKKNIIGTLNINNLILKRSDQTDIKDMIKPIVSVPKGTPFSWVIRLFYQSRTPMVFIEHKGQVIGFITWTEALKRLLH